MNVRQYQPEDYPQVVEWFKSQDFPALAEGVLPPLGIIVEGHGAVFLYKDPSGVGFLEWLVVNKTSSSEERNAVINLLIERGCDLAKDNGVHVVVSYLSHPGLINRYSKSGFEITDLNMTGLVRRL